MRSAVSGVLQSELRWASITCLSLSVADALINWAASTLDRWPCRLRIRCLSDQGRGASRRRSTS